ncbi:DNA helicase RecQ [Reichenbachiella carrageenanivorans]|uniref:DNA helicase RecQ n=1 Tax=Reichenbachiella carrageenanivorans TaxID=2979869 RepID=A0ABY6CWA4_9BACT|nr:DNA helicase RecQ [Reichenbachiella carrageenanivorans]UXX78192.1 DNA helicase RecQ [Reichenbachiella carrageenanivorans]
MTNISTTLPNTELLAKALTILKETFGYGQFRSLQEEVISQALAGQDALVIMPTGGGKSICYQIPALVQDGSCLVISPLISLMKDQVEALRQNGVSAAFLNSTLTGSQQRMIEEQFMAGEIKALYVSPEKLMTRDFFNVLKSAKLNLIAVDEAHCISQWGHDFRPEYTKLKFIKEQFPKVPVMALTATADKATRTDILNQLNIVHAKTFLASFDRPNLNLNVRPAQKRVETIINWIKKQPDESGIIYCLSRKSTESLTAKLQAQGIDADFYHAGMDAQVKDKVQERFIRDDLKVVCATIAFGMGIDKSNVRWVIHHNLPKNLESYYQEIGRAGRDGLNSKTLLFYSYSDVMQLKQFIEQGEQKELLEAKLQRMQQFAEATSCRRKLLLSYFGEQLEKDCGNCDVCRNPPEFMDGLKLAQMALSAVARTQQKVGSRMLIDILRGSGRQDLFQLGYQNIKTYGVGKDHGFMEWQHFIGQFLNLGLLEIAFDQHNILRITDLGKKALYGEIEVKISKPESQEERKQRLTPTTPTKKAQQTDALFERLRALRKRLAEAQGIAAYLVFSDATLQELSIHRPTTDDEILNISGIGQRKADQYGREFINEIITFIKEKTLEGEKIKGATHLVTFELLKDGLEPKEIAKKRNLNIVTIFSHLATLYEQGQDIELSSYISKQEQNQIFEGIAKTGETEQLKPLFEHFEQKMPYDKLRLGLAIYKREQLLKKG